MIAARRRVSDTSAMRPTHDGMDVQTEVKTALVIAAEPSHRMRSPMPTVLRRVGGISVLRRSVQVLQEAGITRILVVVGYRAEDVIGALEANGRRLLDEEPALPVPPLQPRRGFLARLREIIGG